MKEVKLILACDKRGLIGNNGKIPWRFHEDMQHFKETTEGHIVAMGRKTWESLPRKPLLNRDNWILSQNMCIDRFAFEMPSVNFYTSLRDAYAEWKEHYAYRQHLFIIGGAQIYHEAFESIPISEVILTLVNGEYVGDTFFDIEYLKDEVWNIETIKKTNDFEIQRWRLAGL